MFNKLRKLLVLLLIILKEAGPTAACSCSASECDCKNRGLTTNLRLLQELTLSSNKITHIQLGTFRNLKQLRVLKLSSNKLTNILPGTFSNLRELQKLWLQSNNLINIQPGTLSNLPKLQELWLQSNNLTDIHLGTFSNLPQLRLLILYSNKLTELNPGVFSNLPSLQELWLQSNNLTDIHLGTFLNLPQLRVLRLSSNKLAKLNPGIFSNLHQLQKLWLNFNKIANIQPDMFSNLPQLQDLWLNGNQISDIKPGTFSGLPNLQKLWLSSNNIRGIQSGTFQDLPKLLRLSLANNQITTIQPGTFSDFSVTIYILYNNPWQCDCRMVPFRQKMNGSHSFENQIVCGQPNKFLGQKLKDIDLKDLICEEPNITKFERITNNTLAQGQTNHLVCEASGIPSPDITVTLPSGQNATVASGGRVTVEVNDNITITDVTASLYTCTAVSPVGSTFATLSVDAQFNVPTTAPAMSLLTSQISSAGTSHKMETPSKSYPESTNTVSLPFLTRSLPSEEPKSNPNSSPYTLIGYIAAAVVSIVLIGGISFTICRKRWTRNRSIGPDPSVALNDTNTTATVTTTTSGHDQIQHHDASDT
ncbi:uncharacterized protein LOC144886349 [Branchiostoma floridae x Branchiostoma japonicum]